MASQSQPLEPARYEQQPPVYPNGGPAQQLQRNQHAYGYNSSSHSPEVAELSLYRLNHAMTELPLTPSTK
ncbi:hypothetical protein RRF57_000056 [Xylaria bambusicola]|uniref:Uncharacterized protein n=1 Tax=Xylaria bambusicola TaxID=326684 RepID=A0AAN7U361_9PEZI